MSAHLAVAAAPRPVPRELTETERLRSLLDQGFLKEAGWDPGREVLAPAPDHPTMGVKPCLVEGCREQRLLPDGLCATCRKAYQARDVELEEFIAAGPVRKRRCGELICAVSGCPRPVRTNHRRLCYTHEHHRTRLGLPLAAFLEHPQAQPLTSFGQCQVWVCARQAHGRRGLCRAHDVRWSEQQRQGKVADFDGWCRSSTPVTEAHEVALRGLPPLLQLQVLYGVQERSRMGTRTELFILRRLLRLAVSSGCTSILDVDAKSLPKPYRGTLSDLQRSVGELVTTPEDEQVKDVWDMRVFGHGRKRLDFTVIPQPWLREAAKHWVAEELPLRRGPNVVGVLRDHVNSLAALGGSLRLHRDDRGMSPAALGRADIVAFLNRLKHQESTGQISSYQRRKTAQHAALVLRECRARLARPGRPMAGLDHEFAFRRNDLPPVPTDDRPGRSLPGSVLGALIASLDRLEVAAGRDARVAVQLLIDTGRRPAEICNLPWDCLDQDRDGKHALIYTDFKNNRMGRRLAITDATATVITEHKHSVRERFPGTPLADLVLLPRATRNPAGTRPIPDDTLAAVHRRWVDSLEPLRRPDGTEFDKSAVFLYAYRHCYAQRHADGGTPVDVLRELMGHRSMATTQGYYSVTATRVRKAVDALAAHQFDGHGQHVWSQARALLESEHQRLAVGQVSVPFGTCAEPSNVQAGGGACPFRFRCLGCGHFRSDPSYLPELRDYLDTLLRDRERIRSTVDLDEWARAEAMPSDHEINRLRQLIHRVEQDLSNLTDSDRRQIEQAVRVVRRTRQAVHLGMPRIASPAPDPGLETEHP